MTRMALLVFCAAVACGHPSSTPAPTAPTTIPSPQPASATTASLPDSLVSYMQTHGWGRMHLQWHSERRWDRLPAEALEYAKRQSWTRAARQEGEPGNGVEFLAMHRAMLELLAEADPAARALLEGWASPPTDPHDATDPLPKGASTPFDQDMLRALDRLQQHLDSFASEDELGLYIETSFRPAKGAPTALATDRTAGVHNYLHQRFQDPSSPTDLGNPSINLFDPRFWRLHGWIDHVWARYRAQTGQRDNDPGYLAMMQAARSSMSMRMKAVAEAPPTELIDAVRP